MAMWGWTFGEPHVVRAAKRGFQAKLAKRNFRTTPAVAEELSSCCGLEVQCLNLLLGERQLGFGLH